MKDQIKTIEGLLPTGYLAQILRALFDRQALWEDRSSTRPPYRNGSWYTLGASIYLDLTEASQLDSFTSKTLYFNGILRNTLGMFYRDFLHELKVTHNLPWVFLADKYPLAPLPGFHIFPPEETLQMPFGKTHQDLQWEALWQMPGFTPPKEVEHFTFTLPLVMPYQGGGMLIPSAVGDDMDFFFYEEGNLYVHSGQFPHQVLPIKGPVIPLDWRITFQGHGYTDLATKTSYLYW